MLLGCTGLFEPVTPLYWKAGPRLQGVCEVADAAHDEEGGGGVQAGADLVLEQRVLGPHHHLACGDTMDCCDSA